MAKRPNIILIMVDDMGFSDIGCYGAEIRTPHLDRLAANGVRFTQFYNCARCCPTRASLLTGLYPHQAGIGYMEPGNRYNKALLEKLNPPQYQGALNRECVTIAEALGAAGYQTFMSGKWHVGSAEGQRPMDRGFQRYYGIVGGACHYWKPERWKGALLMDHRAHVATTPPDFYITDALSQNAARFIAEAEHDRPFFLYLAYNAPHWPLHAWPEDIARYKDAYRDGWDALREQRLARQKELGLFGQDLPLSPRDAESYPWEKADQADMAHRMAVYAAMVDRMDQGVGQVLAALENAGQAQNTLILFLSDNGACAEPFGKDNKAPAGPADSMTGYFLPWANASNTPFRLFKHWTHEGGIATPLIAHWPDAIPRGRWNRRQIGHVKDLMATCLDAAGAPYPETFAGHAIQPLEGRSLLHAMLDPASARNETIFWEHEGNRALRDGRWKLVCYYNEIHEEMQKVGTGPRTGAWELYDLDADRCELHDLAGVHTDRAAHMVAQHQAWEKRLGILNWEDALACGGFHV